MPIKKFGEVRVELKDTEKLQMQSLCGFMEALGYIYYNGHFESFSNLTPCDMDCVGFNTAQSWHNESFNIKTFDMKNYNWRDILDILGFSKPNSLAIMSGDAKLVSKAKLQWSKKLHKVIVVDHQIEFV